MKNANTAGKKISFSKLFKTILSLVMVLSLLMSCSLMLVGCSDAADDDGGKNNSGNNSGNHSDKDNNKNDPEQYEGLENEEYLQKLESNNLGNVIDSFGDIYGALLGGMSSGSANDASFGAKTDLTLTLGDDILDLLEQNIFGGDIGDMSFLSKINLSMDVGMEDQLEKMQMAVSLNGQKILTLNMLMNMADYVMYLAAPDLNDGWIKFDMSEMMGGAPAANMSAYAAQLSALAEALPDANTLTKILDRYLDLALAELDNVEQTTTTLTVGSISQECTQLTLKVYEADALALCKSVLKEAKDDADLKKIIEDMAAAIEDLTGENIGANDIYADFQEAISDLLADLEDVEETDEENPIVLITYVDKDHNIIGRKLTMSDQDNPRGVFYFYTVTDGDEFAFEAAIPSDVDDTDDAKVTGSGTKKSGKTTGEFTLAIEGTDFVTLKLEDFNMKGGTLTLDPTEAAEEAMGMDNIPFNELSLQIKLSDGIELNILSEGKLLAGLALKGGESDGPNLSEPNKATDAMDSNAMQKWAEKLVLDKVLDNLEKAGVPSELVDALRNGNLFGGSASGFEQVAPYDSMDAA